VPLQDGVAAHDALLVAAFVGTPAMHAGVLALAHRGRARIHGDPLEHVGVLGLRSLWIGLAMFLLADGAQVIEEHRAQYMNVTPTTIRVMGLRTRVLAEGLESNARGDPVVMIHGVGGWAENWNEVMRPIVAAGHPAIAVDLPGFGESDAPGRV